MKTIEAEQTNIGPYFFRPVIENGPYEYGYEGKVYGDEIVDPIEAILDTAILDGFCPRCLMDLEKAVDTVWVGEGIFRMRICLDNECRWQEGEEV